MKLPALLLSVTLAVSLGGAASSLSLKPLQVYSVPGADVERALELPGGQWLVSADNAVVVLGADLKVVRTMAALQGVVEHLALSPDGQRVAAMTGSQWAVWDLASGRVLGRGEGYGGIAFDAQGRVLLLDDGLLVRGDATGTGAFLPLDVDGEWYDFRLSPDGARAVVTDGVVVQLVNVEDGKVLSEGELSDDYSDLAVDFAPDGSVVVRTDVETAILRGGEDALFLDEEEALDPEGTVLFLGEGEFVYGGWGDAQRYSLKTGEALGRSFDWDAEGRVVSSADGKASLALGRGVALFDTRRWKESGRVNLPSANAWLGAFLPDGTAYAGVDGFRNLKTGAALNVGPVNDLYDFDAQRGVIWTLNGTTVRVTEGGRVRQIAALDEDAEYEDLVATPDGSVAVASGYYGFAVLNAKTGKVVRRVTEDNLNAMKIEDVHAAAPTPDGKGVLLIPHEGDLRRYDVATGKLTVAFKAPAGAELQGLQLSPGGTLAVTYLDSRDAVQVALVKPGATTAFKTVPLGGRVRSVRFSPDGKLLAVLTSELKTPLYVLDTATGAVLTRTGAFSTTSSLLAWSPNGQQLMVGAGTAGQPGSVTVFSVLR